MLVKNKTTTRNDKMTFYQCSIGLPVDRFYGKRRERNRCFAIQDQIKDEWNELHSAIAGLEF